MKKRMISMLLLLALGQQIESFEPIFSSLTDLQRYATNIPEYPPVDNEAWTNPDYSTFLKQQVPGWWQTQLYKMHLKSWPLWHIGAFHDLLLKITEDRERDGYKGRFVIKMHPAKGATFIIWGDLQGAYHSLVRGLNYLHAQGIISGDLRIIKPDYFFVFNGDAINRSAYTLEVMTVIMQLMSKNPQNVFYIRGNNEDQEHWKNFSLKRDLIIRARALSSEEIPLSQEISNFFDTLPLALYLITKEDENGVDLIRISYFARDKQELSEEQFSGFFKHDATMPHLFKLDNTVEPLGKKITIRAIVKGEQRLNTYRPTPGLIQVEADKGSTSWEILSSPTESYRELQDFFYDALSILEIGARPEESTITLYNQDVREQHGFRKVVTYNLFTGLRKSDEKEKNDPEEFVLLKKRLLIAQQEIEELEAQCRLDSQLQAVEHDKDVQRASQQPLIVATLTDLSGAVQEMGKNVRDGMQMVFDETLPDNRPVQLMVYDDAHHATQAKENATLFLKDYSSGILVSPQGSLMLLSYLDLIKEGKIAAFFPVAGSSLLRRPELRNVVFFRPSHAQELSVATHFIYKRFGIQKLAVVYHNHEIGKAVVAHLEEQLKKYGINTLLKVPCDEQDLDVSAQVALLQKEEPQEICFVVIPTVAHNIIQALNVDFFQAKHLYGWSDLCGGTFRHFIRDKGIDFLFVNVVPNSDKSSLEIVKSFQEVVTRADVVKDQFTLEGYINASIFVYLLKQVKGFVTKEALMDAAEKIINVRLGGLLLNFDPKTRQLSNTVWLDKGSQDWIEARAEIQ